MTKRMALAVALVVVSMGGLQAQHAKRITVKGEEVQKRVDKLMKSYDWTYDDLGELQDRAKKDDKLVFWLQIVGELDGGL